MRRKSFVIILMLLCARSVGLAANYEDGLKAWKERSYTKAFRVFSPLAYLGDANAQLAVGHMYDQGLGMPANKQNALKWFRLAADQGQPEAQFCLAMILWKEQENLPDRQEALQWFRQAAQQEHRLAQFNLAIALEAVSPWACSERAMWLYRSAEAGAEVAQSKLGRMWETGKCVPQSIEKASQWYRMAAERGQSQAQCNLGVLLKNGVGIARDLSQSAQWFAKAAESGLAEAQYNLGLAYQTGAGVPPDAKQAAAWYQKAADQEQPQALCNLAYLYENGQGVDQDRALAMRYYQKASAAGLQEAGEGVSRLLSVSQGEEPVPQTNTNQKTALPAPLR